MSDNNAINEYPEEEMTVDLVLEDGTQVTCDVVTILEIGGAEYVALLPQSNDPLAPEQDVWFYRYSENPDDPNEEPILGYIDDDTEYEIVLDAFEEYLDNQYFDDIEE